MQGAPYFSDAMKWYRANVEPQGDRVSFLGSVISVALGSHSTSFALFDGLGYVRCTGPNEWPLATTAARYANTAKGFVVELPVLSMFVDETKQPTSTQTDLDL